MYMLESFRWYGPNDPVSLADIRQTGASGVITSLHHIPYGAVWSPAEIATRQAELAAHGLVWSAVESLPVSEDIKTRSGDCQRHLDNYRTSLRHLGAAGVKVVIYNFMPVLDWVRTDLRYRLPDGTEVLRFDPVRLAAFDLFLLARPDAERDWTAEQRGAAELWDGLDAAGRAAFERDLIDVFPGCKMGLRIADVRRMLARYAGISPARMREHLKLFLEAVVPAAEEAGVRLAIHPDDPPWPILGLPRILGCEADIQALYGLVDSPANGLCLCAGSLSARPDNDIPGIVRRLGDRIHVAHLRTTRRFPDGSFYEDDHLGGSIDMYEIVKALLSEQKRRREAGRADAVIPYRPDHGRTMLDDLTKPRPDNPGYSCLGRMKGLAELRGLELGIGRSLGLAP